MSRMNMLRELIGNAGNVLRGIVFEGVREENPVQTHELPNTTAGNILSIEGSQNDWDENYIAHEYRERGENSK